MSKFFNKIFGRNSASESAEFDVQKFASELEFDHKGLNRDQKALVEGMQHRLQGYQKEMGKGGVSEERTSEIAREVFIISCASTKSMDKCLAFYEKAGLDTGNNLNNFSKDDPSLNPLAAALAGGRDKKEIGALVDAGADVNFKSEKGNNLAHFAAAIGVTKDVIGFLIDKFAVDINAENKAGMTARDVAGVVGKAELVEILKKKGGKFGSVVDGKDEGQISKNEELAKAVSRGDLIETNYDIARGADPNARVGGTTIAQTAVNTGNIAVASSVIYGATVATKEAIHGETDSMKGIVENVGSKQTRLNAGDGTGNFSWAEYARERAAASESKGGGRE